MISILGFSRPIELFISISPSLQKMYYWPSEGGYLPGIPGMIISGIIFLIWTDCFVYWIHRFLHTFPWLYQNVHKEHHVWKIPTPWASCAFHPLDGWAQSVPYLVFPYLFPVQKHQYMIMYAFVKMWSVSIHDRFNVADNWLVNGASHHDIHHRRFDYNYGQYFTFWDRIGKSHYDTDIHGGDPGKSEREREGWVGHKDLTIHHNQRCPVSCPARCQIRNCSSKATIHSKEQQSLIQEPSKQQQPQEKTTLRKVNFVP